MTFIGIVLFLVGLFLALDSRDKISGYCSSCRKGEDKALKILEERYVQGEITTEQFKSMRSVLLEKTSAPEGTPKLENPPVAENLTAAENPSA